MSERYAERSHEQLYANPEDSGLLTDIETITASDPQDDNEFGYDAGTETPDANLGSMEENLSDQQIVQELVDAQERNMQKKEKEMNAPLTVTTMQEQEPAEGKTEQKASGSARPTAEAADKKRVRFLLDNLVKKFPGMRDVIIHSPALEFDLADAEDERAYVRLSAFLAQDILSQKTLLKFMEERAQSLLIRESKNKRVA